MGLLRIKRCTPTFYILSFPIELLYDRFDAFQLIAHFCTTRYRRTWRRRTSGLEDQYYPSDLAVAQYLDSDLGIVGVGVRVFERGYQESVSIGAESIECLRHCSTGVCAAGLMRSRLSRRGVAAWCCFARREASRSSGPTCHVRGHRRDQCCLTAKNSGCR